MARRGQPEKPRVSLDMSTQAGRLGTAIYAWRRHRGYEVGDLATRAGLRSSYISQLEFGRIAHPNHAYVQKLAIALVTDSEWLYEGVLPSTTLPTDLPLAFHARSFLRTLEQVGPLPRHLEPGAQYQGLDTALRAVHQYLDRYLGKHSYPSRVLIRLNLDIFERSEALRPLRTVFWAACRRLVEDGWHIDHVTRMKGTPAEAWMLLADLQTLLRFEGPHLGGYCLTEVKVTQTNPYAAETGYIVVPKLGGLLIERTSPGPDGYTVTVLDANHPHVATLAENHPRLSRRLLLRLFPTNGSECSDAVTDILRHDGAQLLLLNGITHALVPIQIQSRQGYWVSGEGRMTRREVDAIIAQRQHQHDTLAAQLKAGGHSIRHVYLREAIDRLLSEGIYSLEDVFIHRGAPALDDNEKGKVLNAVQDALKGPSFALRLVDANSPLSKDSALWASSWLVKEGYAVLFERMYKDNKISEHYVVALEIRHPQIVRAYVDYFETEIWEQLPPQDVARYLDRRQRRWERALPVSARAATSPQ